MAAPSTEPAESVSTGRPAPTGPVCRIASFPPVIPQNPYQRLLYAELSEHGFVLLRDNRLKLGWLWRGRGGAQILHFHWPQAYYASPYGTGRVRLLLSWVRVGMFASRLALAKLLGYRIVWTIHELYPHERMSAHIDRVAARVLAGMSPLLIAHDRRTAELAEHALHLRRRRVEVVPLGSYVGIYPRGRDRAAVRSQLGLPGDGRVFLSFGHIRRYKDLDLLVSAFTALPGDDLALVIAGLVMDEGVAATIREAAASDRRIKTLLEFVPDERVAELFEACDVAVISRGDGGTSGALVLALSFGVPVVAADSAAYAELTDGPSAAWLFRATEPGSLRAALERAAVDPGLADKAAVAREMGERLRWSEAGSTIARLMYSVL